MTRDEAPKTREFSAKEGVYEGGGLKFTCGDPDFKFTKEIRVRRIQEQGGVVTWIQGNFVVGTSTESSPLRIEIGDVHISVATSLARNQNGLKVTCSISGVIPEKLRDSLSVTSVPKPAPPKKGKRR